MEIELTKILEVKVYDLIADLYVNQEALEYKKILEVGNDEAVNERSIKKFFDSYSEKILNSLLGRIIEHLVEEDLITLNGKLTKKGQKVIENGKMPKYEKGKYRFWCVNDELIGQRIIKYIRVESEHTDVQYDFPLNELEGKYHKDITIQDGQEFFLEKINRNQNNEIPYQEKFSFSSKLDLIWTINKNSKWTISGALKNINGNEVKYTETYQETISINDIIESIFQENYEYDSELEGIILEFDQIPEDSIFNLQLDLQFNDIEVLNYGKFNKILVKDISIIPKNIETAKKLLLKIIKSKLESKFLDQKSINLIIDNFKKRKELKKIQDFQLTNSEIIDYLKSNNHIEEYWHIQAPIDLEIL
ncbi:MAG: hypothetical protein ACTSVK_09815 [Promethearchaeota archaeon]